MIDSRIELARLKWFLGQVLALLSLWTVSALDMAQGPVLSVVLILCLVVTAFPRLAAAFSGSWQRFGVPLLILFFIGDVVLSAPEVLVPMVRLLLILLLIRAANHRGNREDLQLMLLGMFLSVVSGVFTLSMLFAVQALFFAFVSIGLLYLVNLLDTGDAGDRNEGKWEEFRWKEFLAWLWFSFDRRVIRSLAGLLLLLTATTVILFVAIPRVYLDQAIPFLRLPTSGVTGFSDTVRLGDVTAIQENDGIAMRVDVPGMDSVPENPYWRMVVLDLYQNGVFQSTLFDNNRSGSRSPQVHSFSPYPSRWFGEDVRGAGTWTFYMEGGVSNYLPVLGPFREMRFQGRQPLKANTMLAVFRIPETTSSVFSYQVEDFRVGPSISGSSMDGPLLDENIGEIVSVNDELSGRYPYSTLALPIEPGEREFLDSILAEILPEEGATPIDKATAIGRYLRSVHDYSLSPGKSGGGDPVVGWLREGRDGHCEYFAGAFTLLARAAGVPTRMVAGFSGGSWNSYEDYFVVRNRNAHAWCEVFDGEEWVRFDPVPGANAPGSGGTGAVAGLLEENDFRAWVDSLRVMWYRRVINFDDSSQQEIVKGLTGKAREIGGEIKDAVVGFAKDAWTSLVSFVEDLKRGGAAWLVLAVFAASSFLLSWLAIRAIRLLWPGSGVDLVSPLRRKAARELDRLDRRANALPEKDWKPVREDLLAVRFGRDPNPDAAREIFIRTRSLLRLAGKKTT